MSGEAFSRVAQHLERILRSRGSSILVLASPSTKMNISVNMQHTEGFSRVVRLLQAWVSVHDYASLLGEKPNDALGGAAAVALQKTRVAQFQADLLTTALMSKEMAATRSDVQRALRGLRNLVGKANEKDHVPPVLWARAQEVLSSF